MEFLLTPRSYKGDFTPENLVFNANLQDFAQRVSYISKLESNGQLSLEEAYSQIDTIFEALTHSKQHLGIG